MEEEADLTAEKEKELNDKDKQLKKQLEDAKLIEIDKIKKKYADKRLKDKKKELKKYEKITKVHHKRLIDAENQLENARNIALKFGVSNLKDAFDKKSSIYKVLFAIEKAMAISKIIVGSSKSIAEIGTSMAIANAKAVAASPLTFGMPWVAINTAIATKQTIATKINAGVQIASIVASAIKGFKDGGPTGKKAMYQDQYGKVTGVVHDNEWVAPKFMTESPRYAPTIQWLEKERKKELGYYFDGGNTSSTPNINYETEEATEQSNNDNSIMLSTQLTRLNSILENGIMATVLIGDDKIEDLKDREKVLTNSLENAKIQ